MSKIKIGSLIVRLYNGRKLKRRYTGKGVSDWRKIYAKLASAENVTRYFIRVVYGKGENRLGNVVQLVNEYDGPSLKEARKAFSAFLEDSL